LKPRALMMQAFGPFWSQAQVDFSAIPRQGLFLIHGPVGAGKTSLLDGMTFALYGVSSGGERAPEELRCDLSAEAVRTIVQFDFEADGAGWRVIRGLDSEAQLAPLDGGEPVARGSEAVEARVRRLLGLDSFQFRRSVVLAQGQFRQFLLAQAGEREQILAALFHTHSPRMYQQALTAALQETEGELKLAWQRRENTSQADGISVHEAVRLQERRLDELQPRLRRLQEQQGRVLENRERAAVVAERSRERERVRLHLQQIREHEADLHDLRQQATRMEQALVVATQVAQWEQAQSDEVKAEENFRLAEAELQQRLAALPKPQSSAEEVEQLQQQRQDLTLRMRELDRWESEGQRLAQAEERLRRCKLTKNELDEEGKAMRRELESARTRLSETERLTEDEQTLRGQLSTQQKQLEELRTRFKAQRQVDELQQGIERVQQSLGKIGERRTRILEHVDGLERQISDRTRQLELHWAASLAQQLRDGQPCPVCGSPEHPVPAEAGGSPGQATLEQMRKQLDLAWKQAEQIEQEEREQQTQVVRLEERLETARAAAPAAPVEAEAVQTLAHSLRELERELHRLDRYRENAERDRRRVRKLEKKVQAWVEARTVALQALTQAETMVEERRALLPPEGLTPQWVEQQRARLQAELDAVQTRLEGETLQIGRDTHLYASFTAAAEAARQSIALSQERTRLAWELVQTRLEMNGFADLDEWRAMHQAALSDLQHIRNELHTYEHDVQRLEEDVQRAEQLYHDSLEDWRELELDPGELENNLQDAYAQVAATEETLRALQRQITDYDRAVQEIQTLEPRLSTLRRLARAATGENTLGLSFQAFVLAQQMEDVLQAANYRLSQMTRGRFTLEARAAALELSVVDHFSGASRGVATLSGGESFLASLALALGLSDSFQSSGHNAVLDTLFIDEGFGYLDEDGLDQAFRALESIQRDGRLIGVISHLAEVRQRIPVRLEVRPDPAGHQLVWQS
jgi:DNA repair protein SbcC/Rad50